MNIKEIEIETEELQSKRGSVLIAGRISKKTNEELNKLGWNKSKLVGLLVEKFIKSQKKIEVE